MESALRQRSYTDLHSGHPDSVPAFTVDSVQTGEAPRRRPVPSLARHLSSFGGWVYRGELRVCCMLAVAESPKAGLLHL